jgi:UDP-N-acetylglucosamine 4,6-dehydratase
MTRFWLNLDRAIDLVNLAHEKMLGGELFVPKIPSVKITDVARAIDPDGSFEIVGIRPGEKLHEEMISREEGRRALEASDHYIILPTESDNFEKSVDYSPAESGFRFSSDTNKQWLSIDEIKKTLD